MTPLRLKAFRAAVLVPVLLVAAAGGVLAVTHDGQPASAGAPPPPAVSVARVVQREFQPWDEFTGRITAVETVDLRPRVSGYIERVAYEEGREVRKGDLLFVVDQRRYRAAFDRAVAEFERARSEARLAGSELERAETLLASKAISREEFEARRAAHVQGDAAVRAAAAAVDAARLDLEFTEVRSPIDGRAGRALVTVGNLAQADSTLLTTLVSLDPMYVYFDADEQTYLRYRAAADKSDYPVRVGLANEAGFGHLGHVDFIDNKINANTGTIQARAVLDNADSSLTPGLFARVQLQGGAEFQALLVDDKAILTDQDRKFVYVVGADHTAQRRDIGFGGMADGLRVVTSGLKPQDQVVVDGVQKIFFPGMPVKATPQAAAPAAKAIATR